MITLDSVTDNMDGTVTVIGHDTSNNSYTSIIGLANAPDPTNAADSANITYYQNYIESTIPPTPQAISLG